MNDLEHMPIADSKNDGEGLAPLSTPAPSTNDASTIALPVVISEWQKNSREILRVRIDSYKGQTVIDCRAWYQGKDRELKPGRGGLTLSTRHLKPLTMALIQALSIASKNGLVQEGGDE